MDISRYVDVCGCILDTSMCMEIFRDVLHVRGALDRDVPASSMWYNKSGD